MTSLVGSDNFYEDFHVGDRFRHWRGKTITDYETQTLSMLLMNTSAGHFDAHAMQDTEFGTPLVFGGVVASIVIGLSSQDTGEQVTEELGIEEINFHHPTRTGDTLYVVTEVLHVSDSGGAGSGRIRFRHLAVNQDEQLVCELVRHVEMKRRPRTSGAVNNAVAESVLP